VLAALALAGCATIKPSDVPPPRLYALEAVAEGLPGSAPPAAPAILVAEPRARAGFDTPAMRYTERPHELAEFTASRWADSPARMLAPLLVQALERGGRFGAVALAPAGVAAGLRLDTEIGSLLQDFTARPSRVRFVLRAQLVDAVARRVVATRTFEAIEQARTDDAYGGVQAANLAVGRVVGELAGWCAAESPPAGRE
jgi:cholesterol transport system auxiliary component